MLNQTHCRIFLILKQLLLQQQDLAVVKCATEGEVVWKLSESIVKSSSILTFLFGGFNFVHYIEYF